MIEDFSELRARSRRLTSWRGDPEMYLLRDFEKAEIESETLTARFKGGKKATIRLQLYSPALLQEVKNYIEEAAKYCK